MPERTAKRSKSAKTYALNVCLVLASVVVAVIVAEVCVRFFYPYTRDHVVPAGLFRLNTDLGWSLTSNAMRVHRTRYFETAYETNRFGYRDKPRGRERTPGTYRILLYGDSQIFGWGVELGKRMSDLLEQDIENLEVWNLAVPGYGLDQQIVSYHLDGGSFDADEVLLFVSAKTLWRMRKSFLYAKYKPQFYIGSEGTLEILPIPEGRNAALSAIYRTISPLYLPYFLQRKLSQLRSSADMRKPGPNAKRSLGVEFGQLERRVLRKAKTTAESRNQKLSIIANLNESLMKALKQFCRAEGIAVYGIASRSGAERFGPHDWHWNVAGNKNMAAEIQAMITLP